MWAPLAFELKALDFLSQILLYAASKNITGLPEKQILLGANPRGWLLYYVSPPSIHSSKQSKFDIWEKSSECAGKNPDTNFGHQRKFCPSTFCCVELRVSLSLSALSLRFTSDMVPCVLFPQQDQTLVARVAFQMFWNICHTIYELRVVVQHEESTRISCLPRQRFH